LSEWALGSHKIFVPKPTAPLLMGSFFRFHEKKKKKEEEEADSHHCSAWFLYFYC
jgi:hypothetical protein